MTKQFKLFQNNNKRIIENKAVVNFSDLQAQDFTQIQSGPDRNMNTDNYNARPIHDLLVPNQVTHSGNSHCDNQVLQKNSEYKSK